MSSIEILRVPLPPVDLSGVHDFQKMQVQGLSLSVDLDARTRIAAAAEAAKLGTAAVPYLIAMLDQDRTSAATGDLVAVLQSGRATQADGRRVENMAWFGEADLACMVSAQDALARIGSSAIPALTEALQSPSVNRRIGAAKALGKIGAGAGVALPLLKGLAKGDPTEHVRKAASEAVKLIKPSRWF